MTQICRLISVRAGSSPDSCLSRLSKVIAVSLVNIFIQFSHLCSLSYTQTHPYAQDILFRGPAWNLLMPLLLVPSVGNLSKSDLGKSTPSPRVGWLTVPRLPPAAAVFSQPSSNAFLTVTEVTPGSWSKFTLLTACPK